MSGTQQTTRKWTVECVALVRCITERNIGDDDSAETQDDESSPSSSGSLSSHPSPAQPPRRPSVTSTPRDVVRYVAIQASTARHGDSSAAASTTRSSFLAAASRWALLGVLLLLKPGVARAPATLPPM